MSISEFGALAQIQPDEVKRRILTAIESERGNRRAAAKALGITHRMLYRMIGKLSLWGDIDRLVKRNSFPRTAGPPRTAEMLRAAVLEAKGDLASAAALVEMTSVELFSRLESFGLVADLNRRLRALELAPIRKP
ncbi:MAG TPA: helix-turn-helix domain-containing protein [Gaiellaceae bacterium]|jgi:hypothetical protein|nr:helix-turn-helix domain-containing protein [Gaiellaceae bacterium]